MWRIIKRMYKSSKSAVLLGGEQSEEIDVEQGVAFSSFSRFSLLINGLLREVEEAEIGIDVSRGGILEGLLFVNDFVGVSESNDQLEKLMDVVHAYSQKWMLKS